MGTPEEQDFPPGHPGRHDYDPNSKEAIAWAKKNFHPKGERDFPVGHPKAVDTEGNTNDVPQRAGVDPANPELEEFSGRKPEVAAALREFNSMAAEVAKESPVVEPTVAPNPPAPGDTSKPPGQPGTGTNT